MIVWKQFTIRISAIILVFDPVVFLPLNLLEILVAKLQSIPQTYTKIPLHPRSLGKTQFLMVISMETNPGEGNRSELSLFLKKRSQLI